MVEYWRGKPRLRTVAGRPAGKRIGGECIALAGITRREAIHITIFSVVVGVFTIIGAVAATMSLIYYICDRKKK